jgi:predicted SprT family Zn-dependent metalloprotease
MSYVIDFGGTTMEVPLTFFKNNLNYKIIKHDLIGYTHFINYGGITISVHDNTWKRVQIDLRDSKIDSILE